MREKCGPISGIRKELRIEESQRPEPVRRARVIWKNRTREAIGKSNELGDAVSADIFTEISRGVDKWLWMVEAHLQLQR
jgi:starvation-inducible DNA-binding protein